MIQLSSVILLGSPREISEHIVDQRHVAHLCHASRTIHCQLDELKYFCSE